MQIGNENGNSNSLFQIKENHIMLPRADFWMKLREDYKLNSWISGNNSVMRGISIILLGFSFFVIRFC